VSDTQQPGAQQPEQHDNSGWIILGVVLVVVGFFLGAQSLGLVPWPLTEVWRLIREARTGLGIILLGIALIMWAQSGRRIEVKRAGGKLTRSRSEKWIAGVLGGLSQYFGVDVSGKPQVEGPRADGSREATACIPLYPAVSRGRRQLRHHATSM